MLERGVRETEVVGGWRSGPKMFEPTTTTSGIPYLFKNIQYALIHSKYASLSQIFEQQPAPLILGEFRLAWHIQHSFTVEQKRKERLVVSIIEYNPTSRMRLVLVLLPSLS